VPQMIPSLSIDPRTLLNDWNHSATAIFCRSAIHPFFVTTSSVLKRLSNEFSWGSCMPAKHECQVIGVAVLTSEPFNALYHSVKSM